MLWYLISDSARLRQLALEHFGADKLVTQTQEAHHIVCGKSAKCKDTDDAEQALALTAAAGDMLTLSTTDFQVWCARGEGGVCARASTDFTLHHSHVYVMCVVRVSYARTPRTTHRSPRSPRPHHYYFPSFLLHPVLPGADGPERLRQGGLGHRHGLAHRLVRGCVRSNLLNVGSLD